MQLRDALLYALESHRGEDLSGQALAAWLGVSRNAVWKAVESLRSDGYGIRSAPRRGSRLADSTDRISAAGLRAALGERGCSCEVFCYDVIDSTNSEAKRLLAAGLSGDALLAAEQQTGGRGRRGRSFYSPAETGVYFSLVLHPKGDASDLISLTAAAAVAVVRAIERKNSKKRPVRWARCAALKINSSLKSFLSFRALPPLPPRNPILPTTGAARSCSAAVYAFSAGIPPLMRSRRGSTTTAVSWSRLTTARRRSCAAVKSRSACKTLRPNPKCRRERGAASPTERPPTRF